MNACKPFGSLSTNHYQHFHPQWKNTETERAEQKQKRRFCLRYLKLLLSENVCVLLSFSDVVSPNKNEESNNNNNDRNKQ